MLIVCSWTHYPKSSKSALCTCAATTATTTTSTTTSTSSPTQQHRTDSNTNTRANTYTYTSTSTHSGQSKQKKKKSQQQSKSTTRNLHFQRHQSHSNHHYRRHNHQVKYPPVAPRRRTPAPARTPPPRHGAPRSMLCWTGFSSRQCSSTSALGCQQVRPKYYFSSLSIFWLLFRPKRESLCVRVCVCVVRKGEEA